MNFDRMLQNFLKQSESNQKDIKKRNDRKVKSHRYKLSLNRFDKNSNNNKEK